MPVPSQRTARLKVCRACPELKKPLWQCGICSCFVKVKSGMSNMHCPKGKWENGEKK